MESSVHRSITNTTTMDNNNADHHHTMNRIEELKAFDSTKSGVKGLVDSGITTLPSIFIHPLEYRSRPPSSSSSSSSSIVTIPTIDLGAATNDPSSRADVVNQIRAASAKWGFFQIVNHGIPISTLDNTLNLVRGFFEQDNEVKKQYYTRDLVTNGFAYVSNYDLFSHGRKAADWRDTIAFTLKPNPTPAESLPEMLREIIVTEEGYPTQIARLGPVLFGLISEALGLEPNHLVQMGCDEGLVMLCHYYPPCPQPELTFGTFQHADNDFLTVLLQDETGGLQVRDEEENEWVDVDPVPGALVVNIGDLLQLVSNDEFKSVEHRVVVKDGNGRSRVSAACFFSTGLQVTGKKYGPIKELLGEDNPARYKETSVRDYTMYFREKGLDGTSALLNFRI